MLRAVKSDLALSRNAKTSSDYSRLGEQIELLMPDQDAQAWEYTVLADFDPGQKWYSRCDNVDRPSEGGTHILPGARFASPRSQSLKLVLKNKFKTNFSD